jgi:hypothetical protein
MSANDAPPRQSNPEDHALPAPATRKMLHLMKKNLYPLGCLLGLALAVTCTSALNAQTGSQTPATTAAPGTAAAKLNTPIALPTYTGPKYDNRWEVYGGLNFMNGQAGQNAPFRRYNMGGAEVMGTYWWTKKLGIAADYRFGAGTTPVVSPYYNRIVIMQSIVSGGVQYRGPKNRYAAIDYHALAGGTTGIFDHAVNNYPGGSPVSSCPANQQPGQKDNLGLYCNHTAPWGAVGGSIDFNEGPKLAIRLQPDMVFEHFGTETREFFAISMGVIYRLGKR